MEVKMNKEIRDYQESMFMGLDLRQCVCSVLAILTAIGIYFGMREIYRTGNNRMAVCAWCYSICCLWSFSNYHGMTAEHFYGQ